MSATRIRRPSPRRAGRARDVAVSYPSALPPGPTRTVLLATDGSRLATSALRLARVMSDLGAWKPEVITVLEPLPVSVADVALATPTPEYQRLVSDSVLDRIRQQVRRAGGADWNLMVEFGSAAGTIARVARERRPALVALGLGQHNRVARMFGAETASRVARHAGVPVLAVAPGVRTLPFTALVAMDFSASSVAAAREAHALLQPPGRLHLVHVRQALSDLMPLPNATWIDMYASGVAQGFDKVRSTLGHRDGIDITTDLLTGNVVQQLLASAKRIRADLIASGSHSRSALERWLLGSTPSQLLRAAACSVLVVPE